MIKTGSLKTVVNEGFLKNAVEKAKDIVLGKRVYSDEDIEGIKKHAMSAAVFYNNQNLKNAKLAMKDDEIEKMLEKLRKMRKH